MGRNRLGCSTPQTNSLAPPSTSDAQSRSLNRSAQFCRARECVEQLGVPCILVVRVNSQLFALPP